MAEPEEFARRINRIAVKVDEGGDRAVRKAFLAIDQVVANETPKDTGRATSNWIPNLDAPAEVEREPFVPGTKGSTAAENVRAQMAAASVTAGEYDGGRNRALHLTNNLVYIQRLNEGWSAQAPALFVEQAVAAGAATVRGAKLIDGE